MEKFMDFLNGTFENNKKNIAEMSRSVATANVNAQNAKEITTTVQESLQTCQSGIGNIQTLKYDRSNVKKYGSDEEGEHQIEEKLTIQVYENKVFKGIKK